MKPNYTKGSVTQALIALKASEIIEVVTENSIWFEFGGEKFNTFEEALMARATQTRNDRKSLTQRFKNQDRWS